MLSKFPKYEEAPRALLEASQAAAAAELQPDAIDFLSRIIKSLSRVRNIIPMPCIAERIFNYHTVFTLRLEKIASRFWKSFPTRTSRTSGRCSFMASGSFF